MAIYLGRNKVSPMFARIIEKNITTDSQGNQTITYTTGSNYNEEDPDDLSYERDTSYDTWTRPQAWPNLDAISISSSEEVVYMTFKNTSDLACRKACLVCNTSNAAACKIDIGHLNSSNAFVSDISMTSNSSNGGYTLCDYSSMSTTTYPYVIIRVTPASASQHIQGVRFGRIPVADAGTVTQYYYYNNQCVERRGNLPYAIYFAYSSTNYGYMTFYMEKDATIVGTLAPVTGGNFAGAFCQGLNLHVIDFTGWNTSNWTITSLSEVFRYCYNLQQLDLSGWDLSRCAMTNIAYLFASCYNLKSTGIENWNTDNWAVTTLQQTWYCNFRLEELNLEGWNTTRWAVTTMADTWNSCLTLNKLGINTWNTSNWRVTSLAATWNSCYQLVDINLSNWNTSLWAITTLASTWTNNYRRRNFHDIEGWITSNWAVTTLASTWNGCISITTLNLNSWNTSKWKITTLGSTWAYCRKLRELHISSWDVTSGPWAVTTLGSTWAYCHKLQTIEAFQWNTGAWKITSLNSTFRYCYSLQEIDFKNWDVSQFNITDMAAFTSDCRSLHKLSMVGKNSTQIHLNITTANNYGTTSSSGATTILYQCFSLEVFNPPSNWTGCIYFNTTYLLPRGEIMKFFNNAETLSSAIGVSMGAQRYKLTQADIDVATEKNYTIS